MNHVAITLLRTDIDPTQFLRLSSVLSPAELARAARYRQEGDRRRHVVGRAALKLLLARRLGVAAQSVEIATGPHGKPALAGPADGPCFNLSHAGERVAIAMAPVPVGIDLERDAPADASAQAMAWFTPDERARMDAAGAAGAGRCFLDIWTAKEAVLKAAGVGLAAGLHGFTVPRAGPRFARVAPHADCFDGYLVAHFDATDAYRAAVALHGAALPLRIHLLDPAALLDDAPAGIALPARAGAASSPRRAPMFPFPGQRS